MSSTYPAVAHGALLAVTVVVPVALLTVPAVRLLFGRAHLAVRAAVRVFDTGVVLQAKPREALQAFFPSNGAASLRCASERACLNLASANACWPAVQLRYTRVIERVLLCVPLVVFGM